MLRWKSFRQEIKPLLSDHMLRLIEQHYVMIVAVISRRANEFYAAFSHWFIGVNYSHKVKIGIDKKHICAAVLEKHTHHT